MIADSACKTRPLHLRKSTAHTFCVGVVVGDVVGFTVGFSVPRIPFFLTGAFTVGARDGLGVGLEEDGCDVGLPDGRDVGCSEGCIVGVLVGLLVGCTVGS